MNSIDDRIDAIEKKANNRLVSALGRIGYTESLPIIRELQTDNKVLREALRFYGDIEKYYQFGVTGDCVIVLDEGELARKALDESPRKGNPE